MIQDNWLIVSPNILSQISDLSTPLTLCTAQYHPLLCLTMTLSSRKHVMFWWIVMHPHACNCLLKDGIFSKFPLTTSSTHCSHWVSGLPELRFSVKSLWRCISRTPQTCVRQMVKHNVPSLDSRQTPWQPTPTACFGATRRYREMLK